MSAFTLPLADRHVHANAMATRRHRVAFAAENGVILPTHYIESDGSCPRWSESTSTSHHVYKAVSDLITKPEYIRTIVYENLVNAARQGCVYADVLSSCMNPPNSFAVNATATLQGMEDARRETGIESGLAITFKRHHKGGLDSAFFLFNQMRDFLNAGLDDYERMGGTHMAGDEALQNLTEYAPLYREIVAFNSKNPKPIAIHVKEIGPVALNNKSAHALHVSDILQALDLGVNCLAHVLCAAKDAELMALLRRQKILIEQLITSNEMLLHHTPDTHPLPEYVRNGLLVALGTDDPEFERKKTGINIVEGITIADEYEKAQDKYGLTTSQLFACTINSVAYGNAADWRRQLVMDQLATFNHEHRMGFPITAFHITRDPIVTLPTRNSRNALPGTSPHFTSPDYQPG